MPGAPVAPIDSLLLKIEEQTREFQRHRPAFQEFCDLLVATLRQAAPDLPGLSFIHGRVKALDSFAEKCRRKQEKYARPAWQLTDLCGVQLIVLSQDAIAPACRLVEGLFQICEQEDTSGRLRDTEFGYQSLHYIVALREDQQQRYLAPNGTISRHLYQHRSHEEASAQGLLPGPVYKAEIQIRTMVQHAWSAAVHDNIYKTPLRRIPRHLRRDASRVAALIEQVDEAIVHLLRKVEEYSSFYGAYLSPKEIHSELDLQRIMLRVEPDNARVALKIARLADSLADPEELEAMEKSLVSFEASEKAALLRELGMVRWKLGHKEKGRENLLRAAALKPTDADTLCELGLTYFQERDYWNALHYYERAFALDPNYPRALMRFIECRILEGKDSGFDFIPLIRHNLTRAIDSSRHRIEAGMHLPYAWYDIGFFSLLLGKNYDALEAYAKGVAVTASSELVVVIYNSLTAMQQKLENKLPLLHQGLVWVRSLLRVVLVGRFGMPGAEWLAGHADARLDGFPALAPSAQQEQPPLWSPDEQILVVAGSCDEANHDILARYEPMLRHACAGLRGTVCSGGTDSGVSGMVGRLDDSGGALRKMAYLPLGAGCMSGYTCISTLSGDFSPLDPLMLWSDLLVAGISPVAVRLLGLRGGDISAFEFQLGLLLGARVGLLPASGGACRRIAEDPDWSVAGAQQLRDGSTGLLRLPDDPEVLRAFVQPPLPVGLFDRSARERLARAMHENYSKGVQDALLCAHGNIAPWEQLSSSFRKANFALIDHIEVKLARVNLSLRPLGDRTPVLYTFSAAQLDILAEMEHGRWVVERLENGWALGKRDDVGKTRPQLIPWRNLSSEEQEKDRDTIRALPLSLAEAGYEIVPVAG